MPLAASAAATRKHRSSRHGAAMICTPSGSPPGRRRRAPPRTGRPMHEIGCVSRPRLGRSGTRAARELEPLGADRRCGDTAWRPRSARRRRANAARTRSRYHARTRCACTYHAAGNSAPADEAVARQRLHVGARACAASAGAARRLRIAVMTNAAARPSARLGKLDRRASRRARAQTRSTAALARRGEVLVEVAAEARDAQARRAARRAHRVTGSAARCAQAGSSRVGRPAARRSRRRDRAASRPTARGDRGSRTNGKMPRARQRGRTSASVPRRRTATTGTRIEPLVSEPSVSGTRRAATAAPEPPDEPPAIRVGSCGLRVAP